MAKKKPTVETTSSAYETMRPKLSLIGTLMGGTEAMRAAGELYLPKYAAETKTNYDVRLQRAVLYNAFMKTLESLVGKPFSKPMELKDDIPSGVRALTEDIDLRGNHIQMFARKAFTEGLGKGLTHILVEYPTVPQGSVTSLAEERQMGARPYWVQVQPEDVIAAYAETVGGVEKLTHVRICETVTERDGYGEVQVERIRVLEPGKWELWQKGINSKWEKSDEGTTSLDYIPLLTFYADRQSFMVSKPPLEDLAHTNVAHWQSSSDQRNILTVTRFPILAASGVASEESGKIVLGPNQFLTMSDPQGKYYYVEHDGAAIEAGRIDLQDLKEEMAMLGVELLQRTGTVTATEKAIDTAEGSSALQSMVSTFVDFIEQALGVTADWMGLGKDQGGSVSINTEFGLSMNKATDLDVLLKARAAKEISHDTFIDELMRRGVLDEDFDDDEDKKLLADENIKSLSDQAFLIKLQNDGTVPPPTEPTKTASEGS